MIDRGCNHPYLLILDGTQTTRPVNPGYYGGYVRRDEQFYPLTANKQRGQFCLVCGEHLTDISNMMVVGAKFGRNGTREGT